MKNLELNKKIKLINSRNGLKSDNSVVDKVTIRVTFLERTDV